MYIKSIQDITSKTTPSVMVSVVTCLFGFGSLSLNFWVCQGCKRMINFCRFEVLQLSSLNPYYIINVFKAHFIIVAYYNFYREWNMATFLWMCKQRICSYRRQYVITKTTPSAIAIDLTYLYILLNNLFVT